MEEALLAVLRVHNPWLDRPAAQAELLAAGVPPAYVPRKRRLELRHGRLELVVGPRQAGKSTWIRRELSQRGEPVLLLHAEEPRIRELASSPALAMNTLAEVLTPETLLFFEEVQHLPDAALFLKGLVDLEPGRRMVATGSSSFTLAGRTRESLAGRARRTLLLPFSLEEVAALLPRNLTPAVREGRLLELWRKLLVTGGYPEPWFEANPANTLRYLVEAFVLRDVSDLHTIERPAVLRRLLELAAADTGNLVNLSEWAGITGVAHGTVDRYLSLTEEAHVVRRISPFVGGKRAELTGAPKIYFLDNGLRNAVLGGFQPLASRADTGALWENGVMNELLKRLDLLDELRFWRTKGGAEVDFVIRRRGRLLGLEVKAAALRRPTLSRAARSFLEAYRPAAFAVVHAGRRMETEVAGVRVLFLPPWDLDEML